ncbi:hypothetical protein NP493_5177g00000 [Ridgeia piscesae]|uniref:Uncharacterized protein n=1 Tax=Ridgeia piscesae TaxID=27915 RepID=A0AAD9IW30_RIDPI|nr:hypothetical protein NP493_5177g00000 [Ridgeia piscesae]
MFTDCVSRPNDVGHFVELNHTRTFPHNWFYSPATVSETARVRYGVSFVN